MAQEPITVWDERHERGHYRRATTRAWHTSYFLSRSRPLTYIAEQLSIERIPYDPADDWIWLRRMTGRRVWRSGGEDEARAERIDCAPRRPTGQWRAPYGDYFAPEEGRSPGPHTGTWSFPSGSFPVTLPRDVDAITESLEQESRRFPGDTAHDRFGLARRTLASGRVPAPSRSALLAALRAMPEVDVTVVGEGGHERSVLFVVSDEHRRREMKIDPAGGQFLGERDVQLIADERVGIEANTTISESTVETAIIPTVGIDPTALQ